MFLLSILDRIEGICEWGTPKMPLTPLGQQLEPLRYQVDGEEAEACQVAAGPGETGDQAGCDRGDADDKDVGK